MRRMDHVRHLPGAIACAALVIASLVAVSGCTAAPSPVSPTPSTPTAEQFTPAPIHILGQTDSTGDTTCFTAAVQVAVNNEKPLALAGCTGDLWTSSAARLTIHVGDTVRVINGVGDSLGGVVATGTALEHGGIATGTALQRDASALGARVVGTSTVRLTRGYRCFDATTGKQIDLAKCPLVTLTIEK